MFRIFNMGIGLAIVVAAEQSGALLGTLPGSLLAGEIIPGGDPRVVLAGL
jgi:phosphoribosylaminoimidazole (AIR) synthetase